MRACEARLSHSDSSQLGWPSLRRVWQIASERGLLDKENACSLIHPDSQWVHLWDAMVLMLVLYVSSEPVRCVA